MGEFLAEYGPMRFEKTAQSIFMNLISELGLETNHFAPTHQQETLVSFRFDIRRIMRQPHGHRLTTLDF